MHLIGSGPFWTLAVESQFYLLWPMCLLLCKNNNIRAIVSLVLGCLFFLVVQPVTAEFYGVRYYKIYGSLPCLFLGAFFAFLYVEDIGKNVNKNAARLVTAVLGMYIWFYPSSVEEVFYCKIPLYVSSIFVVVFAAFVKESFNFPILGRLFQYIGSRSYSFYAVQLLLASYVVLYTNSIYFPKDSLSEYAFYVYQLMIFVALLFIVTEIMYRFIEKPFRKLGQK
jgi:peptidoglycan/LPS O-acetylase OafA/YrhL